MINKFNGAHNEIKRVFNFYIKQLCIYYKIKYIAKS